MKNENFKFKELNLKENIAMTVLEVENTLSKAIESGKVNNKKEAIKLFIEQLNSLGYESSKASSIDDLKSLHNAIAQLRLSILNKNYFKNRKVNHEIIRGLCHYFVHYHVGFGDLDLSEKDEESKIKLECYFDDRNCLFRTQEDCFAFAGYRDAVRFIKKYHPERLTKEKEILIDNWQTYARVIYGDTCPSNIHILTL